jgi:8-oxo-dGTP diphosphatase
MALLAAIWRTLPERVQWRLLWLLNPKFTVGVSGVVLDDAGRVLLLKHTFRRRYPWGMLSGWVKGGEALEDALRREAMEETGLSISIERLVAVRKDRFSLFLETVYACRVSGGTFRPSNEISEMRWCEVNSLPAGTHPDHAPLIRGLKNPQEVSRIPLE